MIILLTGKPGSGKTTLGRLLLASFAGANYPTLHIDGDAWRVMSANKDLSQSGREWNIRTAFAAAIAVHEVDPDGIVIVSMVAPYRALRDALKYATLNVLEVHLHSSRTKAFKQPSPVVYEPPVSDFLDVDTDCSTQVCVEGILEEVTRRMEALEANSTNGAGV